MVMGLRGQGFELNRWKLLVHSSAEGSLLTKMEETAEKLSQLVCRFKVNAALATSLVEVN